MRQFLMAGLLGTLFLAVAFHPAGALIQLGAAAPTFFKNQLDSSPPGPRAGDTLSLGDYSGKILIISLMGFD